jgi:PadR family transcriptional regulator, regulatory protein PadR
MPPASTAPVLGEFEIVVLIAVLHLRDRGEPAYGSSIRDEIRVRANRPIARGAIYITLDRLEQKRLLASHLSGAAPARDGRPRRLFTVTPAGLRAARQAVQLVNRLQAGLEPLLRSGKT